VPAQRHPPGGEDVFFHLRKLGYAIVAPKFPSPRCRGEIDRIGWDVQMCFVLLKLKREPGATGRPLKRRSTATTGAKLRKGARQ